MDEKEMRRILKEYEELKKKVKELPPEKKKELLKELKPQKREVPQIANDLAKSFSPIVANFKRRIIEYFNSTITEEKPEGKKWLSFKVDDVPFCVGKPKGEKEND